MDKSLSKELNKVLKKQKFKINTSHKVISISRNSNTVSVEAENKKGELVSFEGDYCLISVGRSPYTQGLNCNLCVAFVLQLFRQQKFPPPQLYEQALLRQLHRRLHKYY